MNPGKDKVLLAITGPTASGKTSLAVDLASKFKCEIVSFDSRQFYREMKIGTARPGPEEMRDIPHHFIASHSIKEAYSAGQYASDARLLLGQLFEKYDILIAVGGSGLYLQALIEGLPDLPATDPIVREKLKSEWRNEGLEKLLDELKKRDPEYYAIADRKNPVRIIRALEVIRSSGRSYSYFRKAARQPLPWRVIKIGLNLPREVLYERINSRCAQMLRAGLEKEALMLHPQRGLNALETVGYKEFFDFFEGKISREEAVRLFMRNTRRYAKRQLTWFGKDSEIHKFHPEKKESILAFLQAELRTQPPERFTSP